MAALPGQVFSLVLVCFLAKLGCPLCFSFIFQSHFWDLAPVTIVLVQMLISCILKLPTAGFLWAFESCLEDHSHLGLAGGWPLDSFPL